MKKEDDTSAVQFELNLLSSDVEVDVYPDEDPAADKDYTSGLSCRCFYDPREFFAPSYQEGLDVRGIRVLGSQRFGDYQGDLVFLVRDAAGRYGVTVTGYGSCPSCDDLKACESQCEYDALLDYLVGKARWGAKDVLEDYLMTGAVRWCAMDSAGMATLVDELLELIP